MIKNLFLIKKVLHVLVFMVLIIVLALAVSPSKTDTSFVQTNKSSITEFSKKIYNLGIFVNFNQAASFNHLNQTYFAYLFVALIVLFLVPAVNYQWFKPIILPPPWHSVLRHKSRIYISGLKVSNLQYKTQLTYLH